MAPSPHQQLGQLLCQATHELLWSPQARHIRERQSGTGLTCRVGHGQATYHRYDPRDRQHLITYGARMIAAKQSAATAVTWLSSREIQQRRYFNGELSSANLLAHTCCHEFAHLLQQVAGKRFHGSVHNGHFYRILDQLHHSGRALAVRQYLVAEAGQRGLTLATTPFELPREASARARWQAGDRVRFGHGANQHQGRILRVNRKTCTVCCDDTHRGREVRYRVPLAMLYQTD